MPTFTVSIPGGWIGHFLAGAIVASVIGGTAVAITDTNFRYSTPKIGFYTIAPGDLSPDSDEAASNYHGDASSLFSQREEPSCFNAGAHLPQHAKMLDVTHYYLSIKGNFHTKVSFARGKFGQGGSSIISHLIEDNSDQLRSVTDQVAASLAVIRNDLYSYTYRFCLTATPGGSPDQFFGARIRYEYASAGD